MNPTMTGAGRYPGAGEPIEPEGQKYQRRGQVAEHRGPVIGRAADDPIQGAYPEFFRAEWPSVHPLYTHSPNKLRKLWF